MRADLHVGSRFPDFELPDQTGEVKRLTQLLRGFPGVLAFGRGYF
jgi:peroxiredoxin